MLFNILFCIAIFLSVFHTTFCFNLSPLPNIVIRKQNSEKQNRSSYFGFSLVLRKKSIIIGAPRAQSTLLSHVNIDETGDIYKCPLNLKHSKAQLPPQIDCQPFIFERSGNYRGEYRDHQWLGAVMDGGTNDNEPLLTCAPRVSSGPQVSGNSVGHMHGICYLSADTLQENPVNMWSFNPFSDSEKQVKASRFFYQFGQLGISAHITPNNKEYIMGAPGFNNWGGTAVRYSYSNGFSIDIPEYFSTRTLVLNGYAIGSGYLDDVNKENLVYVSTAPHENKFHGKAYVYRYAPYTTRGVNILTEFTSIQMGEYYGYALLVTDLNDDGLDDIIISAPQHRLNGEADIGAIYVYINKGKFQFDQQIIEAPFKTTARFGTTISSLGDINHDGYKDIAVGAPFFNKTGAVVIYHGSKNGLQSAPKQILKLPENLKSSNDYFGHGLSKGVDIDGDGYTDLAIGSPNSEVVYVYRSYPVVNVQVSLKANVTSIKLETKFIVYQVCFQHDKELPIALLLELQADSKLKRLTFEDNNSYKFNLTVLATNAQKCQRFQLKFPDVPSQIFTPFEVELRYGLVKNGMEQTKSQNFCNDCAVMDPSIGRIHKAVVQYNHGCNDVCKVDLSIVSNELPKKIIIGEVETLKVTYNIQNHGEKAYNTQVEIKNSLNLTLIRMPPDCSESKDYVLICDIAKGVYPLENSAYLEIEYDLEKITTINDLLINATVMSTGNEIDDHNNKVVDKILIERHSLVEIKGFPLENFLSVNEFDNKCVANFVYQLKNNGPSTVKNFRLMLQMPIAFLDREQKPVYYINASEVEYIIDLGNQRISGSVFQLATYQTQNGDTKNLQEQEIWQSLESIGLSQNKTRLETCNQLNSMLCIASFVHVDSLQKMEQINLKLRVKFAAKILRDMLKGVKNVMGFYVDVGATLNSTIGSSLTLTKSIQPVVIEYHAVPARPIWLYLVSIVGGILLLALLTFGLLKIGFFKRTKKEEMLNLLKEHDKMTESVQTLRAPLENQSCDKY